MSAAAGASRAGSRSGRLPGAINMGASVLVLVLVLVIAFRVNQAAPPSIAEFAPQAQHLLQQAPQEQTATFGRAPGGAAAGAPSPAPSPTALPSGAVLLRCVGDPPRQIEDTQSPPCVPYWTGRNGGSTYHGVGGGSIRIAMGNCQGQSGSESTNQNGYDIAYTNFFNARFQFYGRKIVYDCDKSFPTSNTTDPATSRADANAIYAADDFGSLYDSAQGGSFSYYDQLAKDGLVATATEYDAATEAWLAQRDPHISQYEMANDSAFSELGIWICDWVAGRAANHTAGPLLHAGSVRKFGLYFYNNDSYVPATPKPLKDRLAACGAAIAPQDDFEFVNNGGGSYVQQAVTSWNADGVTTAICLGGDDTLCPFVMNGAVADQYYPEWISTTFGVGDRNFAWHIWGAPETELKGLFGLTFTPRQLAPLNEPWWWAAHEGDPSIPYTGSDAISWQNSFEYHSFLAIAAGIQMAGPNLTPATFMRGLQRAEFPNPPSANMEGAVSLAGGGHTWTQDAAVWWWSPTARSPYSDEQAGTVCYYEHGARFAPGDLRPLPPGQDPLFRGTCDSGA